MKKILAINPGSTSTKIAIYHGDNKPVVINISHSNDELKHFGIITEQFDFRKNLILETLEKEGIDVRTLDAVIGRGGVVKPIKSGVYEVNEALKDDLLTCRYGEHASNLGGLIANNIANMIGVKAYIADPVVVDEMQDVARLCGHPLMQRMSIFHALNQKAVAREYAESQGKKYEEMNIIVAHLGGGVSVGAHRKGEVIDVNNALDGEGTFSPERSGTLPTGQLAELCFSGKYTHEQIKKLLCGQGGVVAHLGTNSMMAVESAAFHGKDLDQIKPFGKANATDEEKIACSRMVMDAMFYNVGKNIGAMAAVLHGKVDAIILTGGIAYCKFLGDYVKDMVSFVAPVVIKPGENEMYALASNALRALEGKVTVRVYE